MGVIGLLHPLPVLALPPSPPVLSIAAPAENSTILGTKTTISFVVGNFTFVDYRQKKTNTPNEGHVLLWIDEQNPTPQNAHILLSQSDLTLDSLPPGAHTLRLEVVQNDSSSYTPKIYSVIHFITILPHPTSYPTPSPQNLIINLTAGIKTEYFIAFFGIIIFTIGTIIFLLNRKR